METSRNVYEQPMKFNDRLKRVAQFVFNRYPDEAPLYMSEHYQRKEEYSQIEFDYEDTDNMGERPLFG